MAKQTRKEKKAEEARVLAEMRAALEEAEREENAEQEPENQTDEYMGAPQTPVYHCKRCRSEMKNGVCPVCGFRMYVPMDEKKAGKIKLALTAVGMVVFVALFIWLQIKKG
ncbi:MAG: hypothetical protein IJW60_01525 [Clostridia bacterium]|nr:hypothetical protein [Clostridia bacterium]